MDQQYPSNEPYQSNQYTIPVLVITAIALLAASVIEFSAAADGCSHSENSGYTCDDNEAAWAVAVGVISTFFALILLFMMWYRYKYADRAEFVYVDMLLSFGLVILWAFGAGFNTAESGIFNTPGNGYFATWIALLTSLYFAHVTLGRMGTRFSHHINWNTPIIVFFASLVVMCSAADLLHENEAPGDDKRTKWAVAAGAISVFVTLCMMLVLYLGTTWVHAVAEPVSIFLVALWAAGAGVNTSFRGNGYFFSWLAFAASIHYFYCVFYRGPYARGAPSTASAAASAFPGSAPGTTGMSGGSYPTAATPATVTTVHPPPSSPPPGSTGAYALSVPHGSTGYSGAGIHSVEVPVTEYHPSSHHTAPPATVSDI